MIAIGISGIPFIILALTCRGFRNRCTRHLWHTLVLWGEPAGSFYGLTWRFDALAAVLATPGGPSIHVRRVAIIIVSRIAFRQYDYYNLWITYFYKALSNLLRKLSSIRHFSLESTIGEPSLPFGTIPKPTRAAILQCIGSNPLEVVRGG
ncbi:hypothetical protein BKA70DRAFT_356940 [Coprinopsis sp. MPI-PUGE-AT-0042]|nr:hypothetical protein BKA70DRAFT_356940 [Coprinopsis sp. MPI-PUGE-AT-0042]